ncbi:MAG: anaerobic ribonucleoside-triphosphate reductase activating protein [Lachnospiraceae bacterium]|nr:anaerobic ribonucleoside-triphosphate reductase activating protein [Lachnospiraceae bacterium]
MRYHDITKDDMKNGDGLRVVLWVSGCRHRCPGCQNPVTWNPEDGLLFDDGAKREIEEQLEKPYNSGVTFSGGDPLFPENEEEVTAYCRELKERFPEKTIWLYTGEVWEDIAGKEIFRFVDVLVDGKFEIESRDNKLHWRGSDNQRVIAVQESLRCGQAVLYDT